MTEFEYSLIAAGESIVGVVLKYSTADRPQNRDVSTCCYLVGCYCIAIYQLPIPQGMLKYVTVTNCFKPADIYYVNTFHWKMDGI